MEWKQNKNRKIHSVQPHAIHFRRKFGIRRRMSNVPVLGCNASEWPDHAARRVVSAAIRDVRHHVTAIDRCVRVIISDVNFCLVYQVRCAFATLKFLLVNILIVLLYSHVQENDLKEKKLKCISFANCFLFRFFGFFFRFLSRMDWRRVYLPLE